MYIKWFTNLKKSNFLVLSDKFLLGSIVLGGEGRVAIFAGGLVLILPKAILLNLSFYNLITL